MLMKHEIEEIKVVSDEVSRAKVNMGCDSIFVYGNRIFYIVDFFSIFATCT